MTIVPPPAPPKFEPLYFVARRPVRTMVRNIPVLFKQYGNSWVYKVENERVAAQISKLARDHTYGIRVSTKDEYDQLTAPEPVPEIPAPVKPVITVAQSPITVVITNFQRAELVKAAFESCRVAGVKNVVISASGANADLNRAHQTIQDKDHTVRINALDGDLGCNEMWLRGVRMVNTPWVHILHDDDLLSPDFLKVQTVLNQNIGFVHWAGGKHNAGDIPAAGTYKPLGGASTGVKPTNILYPLLLKNGHLSISPVAGLFRLEDAISTLEECERIKGPQFDIRPNMMVGNDLLLWLRGMDRYDRFYYFSDPLISYGHWHGSVTCDDIFGGHGKLGPLYDAMRRYWINTPPTPSPDTKGIVPKFPVPGVNADANPRVIHCMEWHKDTKPEVIERKSTARKSWERLYSTNAAFPAHYAEYQRDSTVVGDPRGLPFLKDVLAWGIQFANPQDIIMLTNDDTILHSKLPEFLFEVLSTQGATCAHRCEYRLKVPPKLDNPELFRQDVTTHPGRDMFAFTIPWLQTNWGRIPDYILGAPCFDIAMAAMIRATQGVASIVATKNNQCWDKELPMGYVAHIMHQNAWSTQYRTNPSNGWNNQLAKWQTTRLFPGQTWEAMQTL